MEDDLRSKCLCQYGGELSLCEKDPFPDTKLMGSDVTGITNSFGDLYWVPCQACKNFDGKPSEMEFYAIYGKEGEMGAGLNKDDEYRDWRRNVLRQLREYDVNGDYEITPQAFSPPSSTNPPPPLLGWKIPNPERKLKEASLVLVAKTSTKWLRHMGRCQLWNTIMKLRFIFSWLLLVDLTVTFHEDSNCEAYVSRCTKLPLTAPLKHTLEMLRVARWKVPDFVCGHELVPPEHNLMANTSLWKRGEVSPFPRISMDTCTTAPSPHLSFSLTMVRRRTRRSWTGKG